MRKSAWKWAVGAVLVLAVAFALVTTLTRRRESSEASVPQPPKERIVDLVVTEKPTTLRTHSGVAVISLPEGLTFTLDHMEDDSVSVLGPTGARYTLPMDDIRIMKDQKIEMEEMDDSQLKTFGLQITTAKVTARMQSAYSASDTELTPGMRTEWDDRILIEMAIKSQMSIAQLTLMIEWAEYAGCVD